MGPVTTDGAVIDAPSHARSVVTEPAGEFVIQTRLPSNATLWPSVTLDVYWIINWLVTGSNFVTPPVGPAPIQKYTPSNVTEVMVPGRVVAASCTPVDGSTL